MPQIWPLDPVPKPRVFCLVLARPDGLHATTSCLNLASTSPRPRHNLAHAIICVG
jgi:hypothetical protein